jgi:signal transduction histidine kinase
VSPDRQRAAIEHILGAGRHMLQLINDLIDLTGAETGQLQLTIELLRADEIVAEATQMVAGLADERALTMQVHPREDGPVRVCADRNRLRQVLLNLLGNAIKFTPVGGRIEVAVGPGEILVRDTGDGVPADLLPYLFIPFHRGSNGGSRGAEGSGLGLALSQGLMRAMGGDLTLVTTSPAGTEFRVVLPTPVRAEPALVAPEPALVAPERAQMATERVATDPAGTVRRPAQGAAGSTTGRRINSPASMR